MLNPISIILTLVTVAMTVTAVYLATDELA